MIASPVAAFMRSVAVILSQTPRDPCNDYEHDPPMSASTRADDCKPLQLYMALIADFVGLTQAA